MQGSKIRLSDAEMELFCNAEIILTKNSIVQKTFELLTGIQQLLIEEKTGVNIAAVPPKISKGENYLGLPYVILDYPRIAEKENLFFIRSMFWWGNFFSSTLQLSGVYKDQYLQNIVKHFEELKTRNYYVGINDNPWGHQFEEDNYLKIDSVSKATFSELLTKTTHLKIAANWPIKQWDLAADKLIESWKFLMAVTQNPG